MLRKKKKKAEEVRWLITFADLITLLFCFFVYLSLFSKPSVNLDTQFKITENVLRILGEIMPVTVLSSVQSLKDQNFSSEALLIEQIEKLLGDKFLRWALHKENLAKKIWLTCFISENQKPNPLQERSNNVRKSRVSIWIRQGGGWY